MCYRFSINKRITKNKTKQEKNLKNMYTVTLLIYTMLPSLKTLSRPLPARNKKI